MKFIIITILIAFPNFAWAQEYLDKYSNPASKENATYYRTTKVKDSLTLVQDYYLTNDQLASEGLYTALKPRPFPEGKHTSYYENGQLKSEGEYSKGAKTGKWKYFHLNGTQSGQDTHTEKDHSYDQRWDETGKPLLNNGTGLYFEKREVIGGHFVDVVDHKLISAFTISETSGDTIYTVVEKTCEYPGGMAAFYAGIGKTIKYPGAAKKKRIQGRVFVKFIVDKTGKVTQVEVLKGIGGGCDEEAANVIRNTKQWHPGMVREKPVMQVMILPIAFKLGW
jgi:TonB family protein